MTAITCDTHKKNLINSYVFFLADLVDMKTILKPARANATSCVSLHEDAVVLSFHACETHPPRFSYSLHKKTTASLSYGYDPCETKSNHEPRTPVHGEHFTPRALIYRIVNNGISTFLVCYFNTYHIYSSIATRQEFKPTPLVPKTNAFILLVEQRCIYIYIYITGFRGERGRLNHVQYVATIAFFPRIVVELVKKYLPKM